MATAAEVRRSVGLAERGKVGPNWLPDYFLYLYGLGLSFVEEERFGDLIERFAGRLSERITGRNHVVVAQEKVIMDKNVIAWQLPHRASEDSLVGVYLVNRLLVRECGLESDKMGGVMSAKFLSLEEGRHPDVEGLGMYGRGYKVLRQRMGFREYPQYQRYVLDQFEIGSEAREYMVKKNREVLAGMNRDIRSRDVRVMFTHPEATRNKSGELLRMEPELDAVIKKMLANDGVLLPMISRRMQNVKTKILKVPFARLNRDQETEFLRPVSLAELEAIREHVGWGEKVELRERAEDFTLADAFAVYCLYVCDAKLDRVKRTFDPIRKKKDPRGMYKPENLVFGEGFEELKEKVLAKAV